MRLKWGKIEADSDGPELHTAAIGSTGMHLSVWPVAGGWKVALECDSSRKPLKNDTLIGEKQELLDAKALAVDISRRYFQALADKLTR